MGDVDIPNMSLEIPKEGLDAADLDPQFANVRKIVCRKCADLKVRDGASAGDKVIRVRGHPYGIGEVVNIRAGDMANTSWVDIRYPGEAVVFSILLAAGQALELPDQGGPTN